MTSKSPLSQEVKELVINNFQNKFPSIIDRKIIGRVLDNENWNFEKSFQVLKRLHSEFSNIQNAKKTSKPKVFKSSPAGGSSGNNAQKPSSESKIKRVRSRSAKKSSGESVTATASGGIAKSTSVAGINKSVHVKSTPDFITANKKYAPIKAKPTQPVKANSVIGKVKSNCRMGPPVSNEIHTKPPKANKQETAKIRSKSKLKSEAKQSYELIRQLKDPFDRIIAYAKAKIKVMVFMRGCSGSGKTTYAKKLLACIGINDPKWSIYSADDYFIDDTSGYYLFSPDMLTSAHEWNQTLVLQAANEGRSPIVVDNTHTRLWEMKENAAVAVTYGYVIETLEPKTPWLFNESQLIKKTTHNVSREGIQRMLDRYERNITGLDVVKMLHLTYKKYCIPSRQTAELNLPPSKKLLRIHSEKKKSAAKYTNSNTENDQFVFINKSPTNDISRINQKKQSQLFADRSYIRNDVPRVNRTNQQPQQQRLHYSTVPPSYSQQQFYGAYPPPLNAPTPLETNVQLNDNTNNFRPKEVDDMISTFDLINLDDVEIIQTANSTQQRVVSSTSTGATQITSSYYEKDLQDITVFTQDSLDSEDEDDSSDETDDSDEDEEEDDEQEEEEDEADEISDNSEDLKQVQNLQHKMLSYEYVMINSDHTLIYQKEHEDLPKTWNDFRMLSENGQENVQLSVNDRDDTLNQQLNSNQSESNQGCLDNTVVEQNKDGDSFDDFIKNYLIENGLNLDIINYVDNISQKSEIVHSTKNGYESDFLVDKNTRAEQPTLDRNVENTTTNKTFSEASSNTNYVDFELLKQVNTIEGASDFRKDIIVGKPVFECSPFLINSNNTQVSSVLMLDKSSMTHDVAETNYVNDTTFAIDSLVRMFPQVKRENLEELLEKCDKDLDWAVGLMLDSGHELCEYVLPDMKHEHLEEESNQNVNTVNNVDAKPNSNEPETVETSPTKSNEKKRKKKNNTATLSDDSLNLIQNVQDKFKLDDQHYSEHVSKLRKQRLGPEQVQSMDSGVQQEQPEIGEKVEEILGEEEEENKESDITLVMDKQLVIQLQDKFGGVISPNLVSDKTIIHIPESLARQLYSYTFDSIYEHLEQQQTLIDMLINEAAGMDNEVEDIPNVQPSFREIMDHEMAVHMSQVKDTNRGNTVAGILSHKLLTERFPNFDSTTLATILEDTNHSLHEATNLLTMAGHPVTEDNQEAPSFTKAESTPLSRKEAVQQAQAYSDVAGKLYDMREDCLTKAERAISAGNRNVAVYYSEMAKWYMERIEQSNSMAASSMLNGHEGATTLDLHFLQVSQAMKVLDLFLDEKVRELKGRKYEVYIVTGRGVHSPNGHCKIKLAVQLRLLKRQIRFTEQNPGMLKATITKKALVSYELMEN